MFLGFRKRDELDDGWMICAAHDLDLCELISEITIVTELRGIDDAPLRMLAL